MALVGFAGLCLAVLDYALICFASLWRLAVLSFAFLCLALLGYVWLCSAVF